jgi:hypothetical protein
MAVLKILASSQDHPTVERIYSQVRRDFPTTSLATIYKTITLLKELEEVLELGFAEQGSRYDGKRPYPHPHVICTRCGAIVDPFFQAWIQWPRKWPINQVSISPITGWIFSEYARTAGKVNDSGIFFGW